VLPLTHACARRLLLTPVLSEFPEGSISEGSGRFRRVSATSREIMRLALECLGALRVCSASARVHRPRPPKATAAKKGDTGAEATGRGKAGAKATGVSGKEKVAEARSTAAALGSKPRAQDHASAVARVCSWSSDVWLEVDYLQVRIPLLCSMHCCALPIIAVM
jgi:hypothetical protein